MTNSLIPADPNLPHARGLFEGDGIRSLGSFLERRGWELEEARPVQAMYRPGRSCLVRYRVRATGAGGNRMLTLCAETGAKRARFVEAPAGFGEAFGVSDPVEADDRYLVWAYPYDPSLGELPEAASGFRRSGDDRPVSVQPLRYRPRRRGVFRYRTRHSGGWRTSFAKVIPSRKAERAEASVEAVRAAGIRTKPASRLGEETLLVPEVEGRSLREALLRGGSLPSPERVADLVGRLERTSPGEVSWTQASPNRRFASTAELVSALLPDVRDDVERIGDAVRSGVAGGTREGTVHGDLYEAQVLVGERYSLGLIDLDDVALGDPAMDAAGFCAHLLALAMSAPGAAQRLVAYRELAVEAFSRELGISRADLAWREALCMLQLATGPFRVLAPDWPAEVRRRIELAVRLLGGI